MYDQTFLHNKKLLVVDDETDILEYRSKKNSPIPLSSLRRTLPARSS